jgi:endonuclease YncB( thermonuclease family)
MRPIAQHHNSVESQARFRTIPVNEFIDGMTITSLGVRAGETIQDCGFGVLEVWQAQDGFCGGAFSS